MHFNAVSKLVLSPPDREPQVGKLACFLRYCLGKIFFLLKKFDLLLIKPPVVNDSRCQYWRGSICSLRVTNNHFTCGAESCGGILPYYTPPQGQEIDISNNAWENISESVCWWWIFFVLKGSCPGSRLTSRHVLCALSKFFLLSSLKRFAAWSVHALELFAVTFSGIAIIITLLQVTCTKQSD